MIQGIIFLGLLALAVYPGEAQAWPRYNGDTYQRQFQELKSYELSLNSYDHQRRIDGRYWTVGGENSPLPKTLNEQLQLQGTAGEHVGSQRRGNIGGDLNKGYGGGYAEGYGGSYPEGYAEGYGVGGGRGAGGGYAGELMKSPRLDSYSGYSSDGRQR